VRTTRRLPWIEADWSAIGGEGGTSPAASAAAGAAAGASPQLLHPPQLLQLLQVLQVLQLLQLLQPPHDLWHLNRPSRPPHFFLQQPLLQLLQVLQLPQAGASQQDEGAAQVGSAPQQVGSHDDWQQLFLQLWQSNKPPRPPNKQHFFLQQPLLQLLQVLHGSQHEGAASQQVGSQHEGAAWQQLGSQQVGAAQQLGSQHEGSQQLLQLPPPPP
jgi:hypothetical protein